ncbi:AI-2E family transporter [Micromonospora olivasterospora]|uniref:Putative PurR-regulated permease PerM n=1 Tax=Micromonospora olivasterospora TaxID=1880 RepID=A0A562IEW7_MICOL|nr:AI-2E family transporter [Micromonospora olivasterospora]TWH69561.1 putative PurR-regulated permease PerM [Micromonospora olivasterospora]
MRNADDRITARRAAVVIGVVLATVVVLALVWATQRVLSWIIVAAFFAVALKPLVDAVQRRLVRRRALATLLVFVVVFVLLAAALAGIVLPLVGEVTRFAAHAPELLREARTGQGRIGELLNRLRLRQFVAAHSAQLSQFGGRVGEPAYGFFRSAVETGAGVATVIVVSYLMVLQAPRITTAGLRLAGDQHAERLRRIGRGVSRVVTGYLGGNLLISVIVGVLTFVVLTLTGVPFAGVIALLVALTDLIPLVGATVGAVIAVLAGFLHSPTAGIVVLVFFAVYQQVENHLLGPVIMSRAVQLSPLSVVVSILLAAELAGLLGALLAVPAAGVVQLLLREFLPPDRRPPPPTPRDAARRRFRDRLPFRGKTGSRLGRKTGGSR